MNNAQLDSQETCRGPFFLLKAPGAPSIFSVVARGITYEFDISRATSLEPDLGICTYTHQPARRHRSAPNLEVGIDPETSIHLPHSLNNPTASRDPSSTAQSQPSFPRLPLPEFGLFGKVTR